MRNFRICLGDVVCVDWTGVDRSNKGRIVLMNAGAGSNHYRDLTWYEKFFFTPELVVKCLSECDDTQYVCPGVDKHWDLDETPDNYYESINSQLDPPVNTPSNLVYKRDDSIEVQDAKSKFTITSGMNDFSVVFAYRITEDVHSG